MNGVGAISFGIPTHSAPLLAILAIGSFALAETSGSQEFIRGTTNVLKRCLNAVMLAPSLEEAALIGRDGTVDCLSVTT
jgi:hypothetical protein